MTRLPGLANLIDLMRDRRDRRITFYEYRQPRHLSFAELYEEAEVAVAALRLIGVGASSTVGLVAQNGHDVLLADLALAMIGSTTVHVPEPLLGAEPSWPGDVELDFIIAADLHARGVDRVLFPEACAIGALRVLRRTIGVSPRDRAAPNAPAIIFSSGTTGRIKRLVVSAPGVVYNADVFFSAFGVQRDDLFLIFLPLSNFQQKLLIYGCILKGIDFCLTHPNDVLGALRQARPTLFLAPPVFYESTWRLAQTHAISGDSLKAMFGGRVRIAWSGMAPIPPTILRGFQAAGVPLVEAYGMTEYGPIAANLPSSNRIGSVGRPLVDGSVELAPDGEILVHSRQPLTTGYLGEPAEDERQVYRTPQQIATGDIGHLDADGYLFLKGRKKEILVTSSGQKVHPLSVERFFHDLPFVKHAVLMGDGRPQLGLLLVIDPSATGASDLIRRRIDELNSSACLASPLRKWRIEAAEFSPDNGMLTRNLKLNRPRIAAMYEDAVFSSPANSEPRDCAPPTTHHDPQEQTR